MINVACYYPLGVGYCQRQVYVCAGRPQRAGDGRRVQPFRPAPAGIRLRRQVIQGASSNAARSLAAAIEASSRACCKALSSAKLTAAAICISLHLSCGTSATPSCCTSRRSFARRPSRRWRSTRASRGWPLGRRTGLSASTTWRWRGGRGCWRPWTCRLCSGSARRRRRRRRRLRPWRLRTRRR